MNMRAIDFGFKRVDIDIESSRSRHYSTVWFNFDDKGKPSKVIFSADLLNGAIKVGDKVELMQSEDQKTLAFHKVSHSCSFVIRKYGNTGVIGSRNLAMNMRTHSRIQYHVDAKEYDAQVIDDYIIITPKEVKS